MKFAALLLFGIGMCVYLWIIPLLCMMTDFALKNWCVVCQLWRIGQRHKAKHSQELL